ncbi:MAG: hypothetical protein HY281_00370 [Nitrospirae bacterium]|nr:hypothetical protein [Nitrospirota bacterium]
MGEVVVGIVFLMGSAVVCVTCPAEILDVIVAGGVWDEVAGAVIVAMAGCLVNAREFGNDIGAGNTDGLCGSLGLVM